MGCVWKHPLCALFWSYDLDSCVKLGRSFREENHMNTPKIDEIVRRLVESVPPGVRAVQQDLENNFRAVLRASLTKLDLVSRDEFDAQTRVLERTRARLEELERRVASMEGGGVPAEPPPH
jgi:BMFP domain-containing protein YqiC